MTLYEMALKNTVNLLGSRCHREVAEAIDRSPQWLSDRLVGRRKDITLESLRLLARAAEVSPFRLLLPPISETSERTLIFMAREIVLWGMDASVRIRELAKGRGDGQGVLLAIAVHSLLWEASGSLGMLLLLDKNELCSADTPDITGDS